MKKICNKGFKASHADRKAFAHYVLKSETEWSEDALAGMKNKAIKTIMRDYFEIYKSKKTGNITSDLAILIPAIIAMEEFKPYNYQTPTKFDKFDKNDPEEIQRDETPSLEIWEGGFDIEDYEEAALNAFYENPEQQLNWFMNNKIYRRKIAFVKEKEKELLNKGESFPSRHDAFINYITSKPEYKDRAAREAQNIY